MKFAFAMFAVAAALAVSACDDATQTPTPPTDEVTVDVPAVLPTDTVVQPASPVIADPAVPAATPAPVTPEATPAPAQN